ncbi:uncharacterized protein LOC131227412 isoform X2 [Magnolia sinica]|uniref:uncharacterized protein LOC131227412 isoform X2 n=1 Tax=Magnolia sinica TaxID=86752 RepID=UPI00265A1A42|nr:uncharacterized protein LOC131227412 isoform X2 [Magnolia sinica]
MANPSRRNSISNPTSENHNQTLHQSVAIFLKRPQAFPCLLSVFVLLTWLSLRFQHLSSSQIQQQQQQWMKKDESDNMKTANIVRFSSEFPSLVVKDKRGWLLNPVSATSDAGISGGAQSCESVHVGEIRPGGVRANHRHHTCNETFIIWGAKTKFRCKLIL